MDYYKCDNPNCGKQNSFERTNINKECYMCKKSGHFNAYRINCNTTNCIHNQYVCDACEEYNLNICPNCDALLYFGSNDNKPSITYFSRIFG